MASPNTPPDGLPEAPGSQSAGSPLFDNMGKVPVWDENAIVSPPNDRPPEEPQRKPQEEPRAAPYTSTAPLMAAVEVAGDPEGLSQLRASLYAAMGNRITSTSAYIENTAEVQTPEQWNTSRNLLADSSRELLRGVLSFDAKDRPEQTAVLGDPFDTALHDVYADFVRSQDSFTGQDRGDFVAGNELLALTVEQMPQDEAGVVRAAATIQVLTLWGIYKLGHHADLTQLGTALDLIERYSRLIPEFDPDKAGLAEAESAIETSLAALGADRRISAKVGIEIDVTQPYRGPLTNQLWAKVEQITTIRARYRRTRYSGI